MVVTRSLWAIIKINSTKQMRKFWTNRTQLKIWGTSLLLFSFITQSTLQNFSSKRTTEFDKMMLHYSIADLSAQNFMNLYFTSASVTEVVNDSLIRMAALEKVIGFLLFTTLADTSKVEKIKIIKSFQKQANEVDNIEKYNSLTYRVNSVYAKLEANILKRNSFWTKLLSFSNKLYFILYLMGSILLIRGIKLEKS